MSADSPNAPAIPATGDHLCPWWVGYLLAAPWRRLSEDPEKLLRPHLRPGMTVLDLGCAMGFFSLPMARMVGPTGRVLCLDVQERMLRTLAARAQRAGLDRIIETRVCTQDDLGLDDLAGRVDFTLAFHVLHETRDPESVLRRCREAMRPGGGLFLMEATGHVDEATRTALLRLAKEAGFVRPRGVRLRRSEGAVFLRS